MDAKLLLRKMQISVMMLFVTAAAAAGVHTGLMVGENRLRTNSAASVAAKEMDARSQAQAFVNEGGTHPLLNLRDDDPATQQCAGRAIWTEAMITPETDSGEQLVDVIVGGDGAIYSAYYDDQVIPGHTDYHAVYTKRSTDGGATWGNPDNGYNGFAMYDLMRLQPSVEVFETTPGNFRMIVAVTANFAGSDKRNTIACWKDIGADGSFTGVPVQRDGNLEYVFPRLKAIPRPLDPTVKRIVCASFSIADGKLWSNWSDTDGTSWQAAVSIYSTLDQVEIWRPALIEDATYNRLFCVWSTTTTAAPRIPMNRISLSTTSGLTWFPDSYVISPNWNLCAEADGVAAANADTPNKTLVVVWTGQQHENDILSIHYSSQLLDHISVGPGTTWNPAPAGFPLTHGVVYSDADADNYTPSIAVDNRLTGGYRVAFVDQNSATSARIRYTECSFETPLSWLPAEIASGPNADPARNGSTALSSGVAYGTNSAPNRRCAVWPDFRNAALSWQIYGAWADISPTVTSTPAGSRTPTATSTATPSIPATVTYSATPAPSQSVTVTPTSNSSNTATPVPSRSASATAAPSSNVTATPVGSSTVTVTPTRFPTATPTPSDLNCDLILNQSYFCPWQEFDLRFDVVNPIVGFNSYLFVVLDIYGEYWFYPNWRHYGPPDYVIDYADMFISSGESWIIILRFTWPDLGYDSLSGVRFHAALMDQNITFPYCYDVEEFGYGPCASDSGGVLN